MNHQTQPPLQLLEEREGMLLYTDNHGRAGVRALSALSLVVYYDPQSGKPQTAWAVNGYPTGIIDAIATFCAANPGVKNAIDGMYEFLLKGQQRAQATEGEK